jgi:hypothetical protein
MNDWKRITLKDLEILPVGHRQKIPEDYLDANNHMNVILCQFTSPSENRFLPFAQSLSPAVILAFLRVPFSLLEARKSPIKVSGSHRRSPSLQCTSFKRVA